MTKTERLKYLVKKVNENKANIDDRIELLKLQIAITNRNTECGKRLISKYMEKLENLEDYKKSSEMIFSHKNHRLRDMLVESHIRTYMNNYEVSFNKSYGLAFDSFGVTYDVTFDISMYNNKCITNYEFIRITVL